MSLRNGVWHGLRNVKYGKRRKENKLTEKYAGVFAAHFLAPIWVSNFFAGELITAGLNKQGKAESGNKLYGIRVYNT